MVVQHLFCFIFFLFRTIRTSRMRPVLVCFIYFISFLLLFCLLIFLCVFGCAQHQRFTIFKARNISKNTNIVVVVLLFYVCIIIRSFFDKPTHNNFKTTYISHFLFVACFVLASVLLLRSNSTLPLSLILFRFFSLFPLRKCSANKIGDKNETSAAVMS